MGMLRILELIFFIYFFTHIPITLIIDSQALFPKSWYPSQVLELLKWHGREFKDSMMMSPPVWFKSFIYCEILVQFPFFFVASYAFWKGNCRWIRIPAIIYSTHVATTLIPILSHIFFHDFSHSKHPGPITLKEKITLGAIYSPYLIIPLLILLTMLFSRSYQPTATKSKVKRK